MKKKTANEIIRIFLLAIPLFFISCNPAEQPVEDGPTFGKINITVDESLRPVIESQVSVFQNIYTRATINVSYKNETDAISDLLNDSARIVIVTRDLMPPEKKVFDDLQLIPRKTKIAFDAVALITNKNNPDTLLRYRNIIDVLEGKIMKWNQLNEKSKNSSEVQLVFDSKQSGIARYCTELTTSKKLSKNAVAVNSCDEVVKYVQKNRNALGLINLAWIADSQDSLANSYLSSINVAEIAPPDTSINAGYFYKPYMANLALKRYPFMRGVSVISREARAGLGTGFTSFLAGDKGQRMILKSGLLPATMPIRLVSVNTKPLNIERDRK